MLKEQEKSKFNDNQFWQGGSLENQYDLDELMKDLEWELPFKINVSFKANS